MQSTSLNWAHRLISHWFLTYVGQPTEPQTQGWPSILKGQNTLIAAPTGSGKTFAAFLTCIDHLIKTAEKGELLDKIQVVYVSPLKALSNDIHKNLTQPLHDILKLAEEQGHPLPEIRVAIRTGDTLMRDRQAMLKKPPHILVTTPESLYILLTAAKSRLMLDQVKTVIVDEIHALANSKRGSHLCVTLERLAALNAKPPLRIGLSATQKPIEIMAKFLSGTTNQKTEIINIGHKRQLELHIEVPDSELGPVASNEMWDEIYNRIAKLTDENRSTLIFVNTRRLAERTAHHLAERLGEDRVIAHHGSLSRKIRHDAENKLKRGELKALVATASLELGIDIGSIDLVCQIGSPRSIAIALQRAGRAGHWHGAISKARFFATTRDELVECAALVHAIKQGDLDELIIPDEPLDILCQQIIATCATDDWECNQLYALLKKAYPFRNLSKNLFDRLISILSEGIAGSRGRYGAFLFYDQVNHILKARRGARLTAILNGGAIPETGLFTVIAEPQEQMVGTLDEDFAIESHRGDVILLGTTSWRIIRVESTRGRVLVEDAHGASPTVPFWIGEAPGRTRELSEMVGKIRQIASDEPVVEWFKEHCALDQSGAEQLISYISEGKKILDAVPTQQTVIAERFFDEGGGMQLVIHAPFGARINKAWGLALRKKFCRSFNFELQASATDDGINIALAEQHSFPLGDVFQFLNPKTLKETLTQAVLQSPLFRTRWRWVATRSLALPRYRSGKKIPPNILRMLSDDLLAAVFPDAAACQDNLGGRDIELPDHPLITETIKDALTEAMDLEGLTHVLTNIRQGRINCLAVDTPIPSVFSHEILNANPYAYLDDAPLEERRARAVELRRTLPEHLLKEVGKLDPLVIDEVKDQAQPDLRSADEVHDFLQTVIALPLHEAAPWLSYMEELKHQHRVAVADVNNQIFFLAAEKRHLFLQIYKDATLKFESAEVTFQPITDEDAIDTLIKGWMHYLGPISVNELSKKLQLPSQIINVSLIRLETTGLVLQGHFRSGFENEIEWCERRLLARIHRLTLTKLRKEIAPVTPSQFMSWLLTWQHVTPGTQLKGHYGLLEIIKQMQGFEIPANAWESQIFAKRLSNYQTSWLDQLCLQGMIAWGRISIPNTKNLETKKRIIPSSSAPITFIVREESNWFIKPETDEEIICRLSHTAGNVYAFLKEYGASFFVDIVNGVNQLKSEIETALWELVTAGLITADGFDNLRSLIDPHRRLGYSGRRRFKTYGSGRWSILNPKSNAEPHERIYALCTLLLKRYGVVFRDLLVREKNLPRWRELLLTFRQMEDRGEIRGGRFVSGFLGEQFALPQAVDSLRAARKKSPDNTLITVAAVDPMNLSNIILPGERIAAFNNLFVTYKNGEIII